MLNSVPFALARIALGLYLVVHYATLLPFAEVLYSSEGMLASAALNPAPVTLTPLAVLDSPGIVTGLVVTLIAAAASYTVGFRTRTMGVILGIGAFFLWHRNMLTLNPSLPFLGFWFVAQAFTDPDPPFSLDRLRAGTGASRGVPPDVLRALWIVHAVGYSFSGWTKLTSPSWLDGSAVRRMLDGPIGLDNPASRALAASPDLFLSVATWGVVTLELLAVPLALSPRLRPWLWGALLAMHTGLLVMVDLGNISAGMIVAHLFLFDPRWFIRPLESSDRRVQALPLATPA